MTSSLVNKLPPDLGHGDDQDRSIADSIVDQIHIARHFSPMVDQVNLSREIERNPERFAAIQGRRCSRCDEEISEARLRALPLTSICIDCAGGSPHKKES